MARPVSSRGFLLLAGMAFLALVAIAVVQPQTLAAQPVRQEPVPHPVEGRENCLLCHTPGTGMKPSPADHAGRGNDTCLLCHKVATAPPASPTAAPATPSPAATRPAAPSPAPASPTAAPAAPSPTTARPPTGQARLIPHSLRGKENCLACHQASEAQRPVAPHQVRPEDDCLQCHTPGTLLVPSPANHAGRANDTCTLCHQAAVAPVQPSPTAAPGQPSPTTVPAQPTPTTAPPGPTAATRPPASAEKPSLIPHSLEGRAACLTCHGPAGLKPIPADHAGRGENTCLVCHVPATSPRAPGSPDITIAAANQTCLTCHRNPSLSMTIGGQKLSLYIDEAVFAKSVHGKQQLACTNCHTNMRDYPHPPVTAQYPRELNRGIIQQACATCHKPIYDQYKESVHGKALLEESNLDVPSCTDCHGIHNIRDPRTALFRNESPDLCSKCHADRTLMAKYGISPDVTRTYLADFHGATVRLTEKKDPNIWSYKAVCYDCHGIHDIKKVDDPHSSVVKENLVKTCQKCHPGATANFPTAWASHYIPNREKWPVVYYVDLFYRIFIPTVIGAMVLYIILELARKALDHRKPGRKA